MEKRYLLLYVFPNLTIPYISVYTQTTYLYLPNLLDYFFVLICFIKVEFRIGCLDASNKRFAVEITAKRERLRAVVESVKGEV